MHMPYTPTLQLVMSSSQCSHSALCSRFRVKREVRGMVSVRYIRVSVRVRVTYSKVRVSVRVIGTGRRGVNLVSGHGVTTGPALQHGRLLRIEHLLSRIH